MTYREKEEYKSLQKEYKQNEKTIYELVRKKNDIVICREKKWLLLVNNILL